MMRVSCGLALIIAISLATCSHGFRSTWTSRHANETVSSAGSFYGDEVKRESPDKDITVAQEGVDEEAEDELADQEYDGKDDRREVESLEDDGAATQRFSLQQTGQGRRYPKYKMTKSKRCYEGVSPLHHYKDIKASSFDCDDFQDEFCGTDKLAITHCRTAARSLGLSSSRVYKSSRANRPCGCYYVPSASKQKLFYNANPTCWKTPATSKRQVICILDPYWQNIGA
jgi:hypothetical protein